MKQKQTKPKPNRKPQKPKKKKSSGSGMGKYVKFSIVTTAIMAVCAVLIVKLSELGYVPSSFYYASRFIYCCVGGWFAGSLFIAFGMDSKTASSKREEEEDDEEEEEDFEEEEQAATDTKQKTKSDRRQKSGRQRVSKCQLEEENDEEEDEQEEEEEKPRKKNNRVAKKDIKKEKPSRKKKVVQAEEEEDDSDSEEEVRPSRKVEADINPLAVDFNEEFLDFYENDLSKQNTVSLHAVNEDNLVEDNKPEEPVYLTSDIDINEPQTEEETYINVVAPPIDNVDEEGNFIVEQETEEESPVLQEVPEDESEVIEEEVIETYVEVTPPPLHDGGITEEVRGVQQEEVAEEEVEYKEELVEVIPPPLSPVEEVPDVTEQVSPTVVQEEVADEPIMEVLPPEHIVSDIPETIAGASTYKEVSNKFVEVVASCIPQIEYDITEEAQQGLVIEEGNTLLKCTSVMLNNTVYCKGTGCRGFSVNAGDILICSYGIKFTKLNRVIDLYPLSRIREVSGSITLPDSEELKDLETPVCAIVNIADNRDILFDDLSIMMDIHP